MCSFHHLTRLFSRPDPAKNWSFRAGLQLGEACLQMGASRWHNLYSHIDNSSHILHKTHERLSLKLAWRLKKKKRKFKLTFVSKSVPLTCQHYFAGFFYVSYYRAVRRRTPVPNNEMNIFIFLHCFVAVFQNVQKWTMKLEGNSKWRHETSYTFKRNSRKPSNVSQTTKKTWKLQ